MLDPDKVENRGYGVVPLSGGLNFTDSKALVAPGTLQDCMNYEVKSSGYSRGQGLMLYTGIYDTAVEDMWYVGGLDATTVVTGAGSFTLGGEVTWTGGSGTCVYWEVNGVDSYKVIGIVDIEGTTPDSATTFTDVVTGTTFTTVLTPATLRDAVYPHATGTKVCETVTDYLSFINGVNTALVAYTTASWPYFKPKPVGTGAITGGFQFEDTVYAARDYMGAGFSSGSSKPVFDDIITIGGFTGKVAEVILKAGAWEAGDAKGTIIFMPHDGGTNDNAVFDALPNGTTITNTTQANTVGVLNTAYHSNKGQLWKASRQGWEMMDLGYGFRFKTGTNAPNARVAPLFLPNIAYETSPVTDTGYVLVSSASAVGDIGTYSMFNNLGNLYADDGSYASTTISAGGLSQLIEASPTDYVDATNTEIIGIEVQFEALGATDSYVASVRLVNDATGAEQYISDNLSDGTALTLTPQVVTCGGETDLWGMKSITAADLNSGDVKVQIQFGNSNGAATKIVNVDYIQIKAYYISRGQTVYFYDGSSDVSTADVYSFEVHDGAWVGNDATGYMAIHDVSSPGSVTAGMEVRTAASGGGVLIAETAGRLQRNLLPSEQELVDNDSRWETIEANFYQNDEGAAIYGVTGADSAFIYDLNDKFAYIRTPVARRKDKPRHVAFHVNHLALGLSSGHILVSAIDAPNDFDVSGTATAWSFRDPVTGLIQLTGDALGVMCRESIHLLKGTQAPSDLATDPFKPQNITPKTGAIEYTVADVMGPMYADYNGVSTLDASDKFGDFDPGRLTAAVEDWTRDRLQNRPSADLTDKAPVVGIPVRAKNQYRLYFSDGYFLSLFLGAPDKPPQPMVGHYDPSNLSTAYVPTWINSTVLSTGRERIVMGDKNGNVWIVDGANGIQTGSGLTEVPCWITTNPINTGYPQGATKTYLWTLIGDFMGAQTLTTSTGYNYLDVTAPTRTKTMGNYSNSPLFEAETELTDIYTGVYTDGVSLKIQTSMDGSKPHTLHTLIHRYSRKSAGRNINLGE